HWHVLVLISNYLFCRLPSEILIKILSYLDASALFSISHVNKLFHMLGNDNALWYKVYIAKFGKKEKRKFKNVDELLLRVATVELWDHNAGYWKCLYFKTVAACDVNKWKRHLGLISHHTGLPSQTERVLRELHITWELTVSEEGGCEVTLELNWSQFCETSVFLCWSGGRSLPNYQKISTLQLHGVRRIALNCPGLKKPGWKSLMAKLDMQTLRKSARVIGQDRLVELKLLQPGIIIGTWRCSIAFIMFTLHFHKLVERSIKGSSLMVKCPFNDIDSNYGLHGYQLHIVLNTTVCKLMSASFSQLFCHRGNPFMQPRICIFIHTRSYCKIIYKLYMKYTECCGNCCIMSLTLLDEFKKPFWCVSSPVSLELEKTSLSYDYDGEHFLIHYLDSDGQVKLKIGWIKEQQQSFVISLVIYVSVSKVNKHFGRHY
uniref:F-box domain-containing protein n=1 Tax=Echeneis naucrates TaxID=173247 RepID=A0A665VKL8_ECHNA